MQTSDILVPADRLTAYSVSFLAAMGCAPRVAEEVAEHLVEADLMGVFSHGTVRLPQYLGQARAGRFDPAATPVMATAEGGAPLVDGRGGFGQPACRMAAAAAIEAAKTAGTAAVGVANVGHTGRMGAFAEQGAREGCLTIVTGGGGRREWRQVAPYGGARGMLPTNPYAVSLPGGAKGPIGFDFATSAAAGGKVLAAKSAGRMLPEGLIIDSAGAPSIDPDDYDNGGALLPAAGPKGFGMALVAELVGAAMHPAVMTGMNWLIVCVDLGRFRAPDAFRAEAEGCVAELAATPPAPGVAGVEIPGQREFALAEARRAGGVPIPARTLDGLKAAGREIGADLGLLD